jgi:hypothetical protein
MLRYPLRNGFDFAQHADYVRWMATHLGLPHFAYNYETWQAPAFYVLAGWIVRAGVDVERLGALQVTFACLRLLLFWTGVERYLPGERLARCTALALAGVLPCSIHIDGMLGGEPLANLLSMGVLVTAPRILRVGADLRRRAAVVGVLLGLALLSKVSVAILAAALMVAGVVRIGWGRAPLSARLRGAGPWVLALAIAGVVSGSFYGYNAARYGKLSPTAFDGVWAGAMKPLENVPFWARRPQTFWQPCPESVWEHPFWPTCGKPAHFFSLLLATTYSDYGSYGFAPRGRGDYLVLRQAFSSGVIPFARASTRGGTVIAGMTAAAWPVALIAVLRRRRAAELFLLLCPLFVLIGQIHFAVMYPFENMGHVKGSFLQCGAPPLFALFGLAVSWVWRQLRPLALVPLGALAAVTVYVVACRFFF